MSELEELYARIPDVPCRGLCARFCGPIMCGSGEAARLPGPHRLLRSPTGALVAELPHVEKRKRGRVEQRCAHLRNGRCTVYELRPAICRIWGTVEALRCPHGCEPERWLTSEEAAEILRAVTRVEA